MCRGCPGWTPVGRFAVVCGAVMPTADRCAMGHSGKTSLGEPGKGAKAVVATYCWHWEHPLFRLFPGPWEKCQFEKFALRGHYFNRYFFGD